MATKKVGVKQEIKFEKGLEELEKIVDFLEAGDSPLEESLKKYEEAVSLSRVLSEKLNQAEKKVEVLTRDLEGAFSKKPFEEE